jgi:hypothetical protein
MLRKLSIAAAIASVLLLPASAFAETVHRNANVNRNVHVNKNVNVNRNVHVNRNVNVNRNVHVNRNVNVNRAVHGNYVVGRAYNGHYWYGQNRHRWHGRWYAYGVGPCWIDVGGLWFWNVAACPP